MLRNVKAIANQPINEIDEPNLFSVVKSLLGLHMLLRQDVTEDLFTKTTLKRHFLPKHCTLSNGYTF